MHRRRAGVSRRTLEFDLEPRDADDRSDETDVDPFGLEHRALLDVQLESRRDVAPASLREVRGIAADALSACARVSFFGLVSFEMFRPSGGR